MPADAEASAEPDSVPVDEAAVPEPRAPEQLELAAGFPPAGADEWRALAAAALAKSGRTGDDPMAALSSQTYDGVRVHPLYTSAPAGLVRPPLPAARGGWDVRALHADPDPARSNAAALVDLEGGATSLWLQLGAGGIATDDLPAVLDGVLLDLAPIVLDAGTDSPAAFAALHAVVERRGLDPAALRGSIGADPIGWRARTGSNADPAHLLGLGEQGRSLTGMQLATVDATVYHDAGAGDAGEIAIATAVGVAYLRALVDDGGWPLDAALAALEFRFAVGVEQFAGIAKLRAARRVWARVAELSGAAGATRTQRQHAVTSAATMTRRDPWVNMLRTTIGCFAAAIGGAGAITVRPFDAAIGRPDDLARRIARNTHAILHDESSAARVADAAGGSWYVESLTAALASAAWDAFTAIERAGGALRALDGGAIGELIAAARDRRADDIAHRRAPITGVSEFAFPDEQPVTREPAPLRPAGGPLVAHRYAEPFEQLRDRADAAPERPAVFLATLGSPARHSARLSFATNLFQAGGIRVISGPPAEFAAAGTPVACLCASDHDYADGARDAVAAMPAKLLWLAGRAASAGEYDGVDGYVYAGCDALEVLRTTLEALA